MLAADAGERRRALLEPSNPIIVILQFVLDVLKPLDDVV